MLRSLPGGDMPHNFWMINCNEQNYNITRDLGFTKQGLKAEYRRKVQRVEPGDRIIYYVTGARVFTATATVTLGYEEVGSGPWVKEGKTAWPYRIGIKPNVVLGEEQYIDAGLLAYRLEYIRKWPPEDWYMAFQGNLHLLSKNDFFLLETEMLKLRDGRDQALLQIDAELAVEEERSNSQRERRRRAPSRNAGRPPRSRGGEQGEDRSQSNEETPVALAEEGQSSAESARTNGRQRRNSRSRSGVRRPATDPKQFYDNG